MMDSSRSAQRAVIQFLRTEGECLERCTIFRWCQRYEAGRINIKDLPHPGQAHVVINSAKISAVDELYGRIVGLPYVKLVLNCR
ncbi:hypothetical protein AVEN_71047-1 [Araneus ventricosus]|uniref:Mos1 transposase HTH domain-containing protein n=1 Tax=Araneus ventricosus TaxID=182803 RepID=A0A4Y2IJ40_ARAVE|nr:hypothetical protein AVEN_71047-1 [Araneus ventricosus]